MKIKRVQLLELVNNEITRLALKAQSDLAEELAQREQTLADFQRELAPHWEEFARRILDAVIDERPITRDMVPSKILGSYRNEVKFLDQGRSKPTLRDITGDLRVLKKFLEVTTDDEINTTSLERQGFPLGKVLRGAV